MKQILGVRSVVASILCLALSSPGIVMAQEPAPKYKLTIVEDASTSKRVKKGRVSSQAVVKVTDQNNLPVPAIAITFLIPQGTGGAAFASGGLTSIGTTNAAGIASSGTFSTTAGSSFNMSASAAVPGGNITLPIPISTTAVAAAAGISTGLLVGIIAGAAAAAAAGIVVATRGGNSSSPGSASVPTGTIGAAGIPNFGHP
jgi:hypothetical protein